MSTTATTQIPPGFYRFVVAAGALESQLLTYGENYVTVLPPGAKNDPQQEVIHRFHDELDDLRSPALLLSGQLIMRAKIQMASSSSLVPL